MHIYFLGIGGAGIGPLALLAKQAGYEVSGSDKQNSEYIKHLRKKGIDSITIGTAAKSIKAVHNKKPIDWVVYSSAVPMENPDHPEIRFAKDNGIKTTKRDEFLNELIKSRRQKLIAVAGTHGKTTTTSILIWLFKQLKVPVSYSGGGKLSFGDMAEFNPRSEYFVYEADEFDRNFLSFHPYIAVISGIDWDHPDIYPTREEYNQAFRDFFNQSEYVIAHADDLRRVGVKPNWKIFSPDKDNKLSNIHLTGEVNRKNAQLVLQAMAELVKEPYADLAKLVSSFPGVSRRFEEIAPNIYTDYAHTPEKIRGALQLAREVAGDEVIVVYEGLHNTRQHFIKNELPALFGGVKKLYIVPSYLAREDKNLELLTPDKLRKITEHPPKREAAELNDKLKKNIKRHAERGDLVLCLSAGGGGSLDEWLRRVFGRASSK